jgi:hypothetical protein
MREQIRLTIREYFKGRAKQGRRVLGAGVLLTAASVAILAMTSNLGSTYCYVLAALGAAGVAMIFGALLYLDLTRCPNCTERLGIQIANQYRIGRRVAFCPFCGVSFDNCEVRDP